MCSYKMCSYKSRMDLFSVVGETSCSQSDQYRHPHQHAFPLSLLRTPPAATQWNDSTFGYISMLKAVFSIKQKLWNRNRIGAMDALRGAQGAQGGQRGLFHLTSLIIHGASERAAKHKAQSTGGFRFMKNVLFVILEKSFLVHFCAKRGRDWYFISIRLYLSVYRHLIERWLV